MTGSALLRGLEKNVPACVSLLWGCVNSQNVSVTPWRGHSKEVIQKGSISLPVIHNTKEGKLRQRVIVRSAVSSHVFLEFCIKT